MGNPIVAVMTKSSITDTPSEIVPSNANRKSIYIRNPAGNDTAFLKFDSAHESTEGYALAAGEVYEPENTPINSVWGVCAGSESAELDVIVG